MERTCKYDPSEIVVLDAIDAIRRRPGMYLGDVHDGSALHHLVWELVGNSLDEHLAGHAHKIRVSVEDDILEVEDDGRGIPVSDEPRSGLTVLETVLSQFHYTPTYDGHTPHVHVMSSGGLGLCPVNALSAELEIEVRRDGHCYRLRCARGRALGPLEKSRGDSRTGTRVRVRPDPSIFSAIRFDTERVRERLRELAIWNPALTFELMSQPIREPRGPVVWLERMASEHGHLTDLAEPFTIRTMRYDVFVEVAATWSYGRSGELRSFVSQSQTTGGGSHEVGFWQGLLDALAARNPSAFPGPARGSRWRRALVRGLLGIVHVALRHPSFAGPTREKLASDEARDAVRAVVSEAFAEYLQRAPEVERLLLAHVARKAS